MKTSFILPECKGAAAAQKRLRGGCRYLVRQQNIAVNYIFTWK